MRLVGLSQPEPTADLGRTVGAVLNTAQLAESATQRVLGTICPMTGLGTQITRFFWDFSTIQMWNRENLVTDEETLCYHQPGFGFASQVRNSACEKFLASDGGDWLLFLDTDNVFPCDIVGRMLASQKEIAEQHGSCDILTALYFKKWPPFEPLIYHEVPGNPFAHLIDYPEEPLRVSGCGGGCLMIQRPVLEGIVAELRIAPFGWLGALHNRPTPEYVERYSRNFTTEDFPFNLRAAMLGFETWCDPRIKLGHMTMAEITEADFFLFREKIRARDAEKAEAEKQFQDTGPLTTQAADPLTVETPVV